MGGGKEMEIAVDNSLGASPGDRVMVRVSDSAFLKATFLVYMVPVIGLFIGALIGQSLGTRWGYDPDGFSALFGISSLIVTFAVVRVFANRLGQQEKYQPKIIKIVSKTA